MATSLLRIGRLTRVKGLHAGSSITLSTTPAAGAFSTTSGGSKKSNTKKMNTAGCSLPLPAQMDPIQKLFLDSIRQYSAKSQAAGGLVDASSQYEKNLAQEIAKLQRLYGGGDLTSFPDFKFTEPKLDEVSSK